MVTITAAFVCRKWLLWWLTCEYNDFEKKLEVERSCANMHVGWASEKRYDEKPILYFRQANVLQTCTIGDIDKRSASDEADVQLQKTHSTRFAL